MTAADAGEFRQRHGAPASPERIADWLRMCLQAKHEGKCDGVVTYALDTGRQSTVFPLVAQLYGEFRAAGESSTALLAAAPDGNATIRAMAGSSEIVMTTTTRLAGAIHSLRWNGREFIDSYDHGRQLQSASSLDSDAPITPITAETFNPTEAGSRRDATGGTSSSRLLRMHVEPSALETTTQMAFWLAPGEKAGPSLAKSTTVLSNHLLTKRVRIGYKNLPHVISYDVTFQVPKGERHHQAVFEALTGYMPPEFDRFWQFNAKTGELEPLPSTRWRGTAGGWSPGPGEEPRPVVLSLPSGTHAMGIYAPPQSVHGSQGPTYGRFRFVAEKVVKWNCVFRVRDDAGLAAGEYPFRMFVMVGDLNTVRDALRELHRQFAGPSKG